MKCRWERMVNENKKSWRWNKIDTKAKSKKVIKQTFTIEENINIL